MIRSQLGREPRVPVEVAKRCSYGYPLVLKTRPLLIDDEDEFEVFPTLYWLSCPRRVEKIARIESEGYIRELEEELASRPGLKREYRKQEKKYLEEQRGLLTEEEKKFLRKRGAEDALTRGIGGIESDRHIKCLHLHLAHQLAEENSIGKILQDRFELTDCPPGKVRCEEFDKAGEE